MLDTASHAGLAFLRVPMILVVMAAATACSHRSKPAAEPAPHSHAGAPACRDDAVDEVEVGARTAGSGVKTGATTAVEGVKTFGKATAGLVEGGTGEAKERWKDGAAHTKATAKEGSADTKREADVPRCH